MAVTRQAALAAPGAPRPAPRAPPARWRTGSASRARTPTAAARRVVVRVTRYGGSIDDHESCHPVSLRMTSNPIYGLKIQRMTPKILSSCHSVGQPDSMTRSYLVTLIVVYLYTHLPVAPGIARRFTLAPSLWQA